jgi:hypothetical protein
MCVGRGFTDDAAPETCLGVSLANVLIFSLTTEIPRSSEAFSSNTRARNKSGLAQPTIHRYRPISVWAQNANLEDYESAYPNICRARARIVLVFPVPGGP